MRMRYPGPEYRLGPRVAEMRRAGKKRSGRSMLNNALVDHHASTRRYYTTQRLTCSPQSS